MSSHRFNCVNCLFRLASLVGFHLSCWFLLLLLLLFFNFSGAFYRRCFITAHRNCRICGLWSMIYVHIFNLPVQIHEFHGSILLQLLYVTINIVHFPVSITALFLCSGSQTLKLLSSVFLVEVIIINLILISSLNASKLVRLKLIWETISQLLASEGKRALT